MGSRHSTAGLAGTIKRRDKRFESALQAWFDSGKSWTDLVTKSRTIIPESPTASNASPNHSDLESVDHVSIEQIVDDWLSNPAYSDEIVRAGVRSFAAKSPSYMRTKSVIDPTILAALKDGFGVTRCYSHQAKAIDAVMNGKDVIITTKTASGKSLIYQVPILSSLLKNRTAKALLIFPTKALANNQKQKLRDLISFCPPLVSTQVECYDGDTGAKERQRIREECSIILTNPDMIHASVLPNNEAWGYFLQNLRFIIIDEIHMYRGTFGANVALVLRRLLRICEHFGNNNVQFVSCSATMSNPSALFYQLTTRAGVVEITDDGSPSGAKHFICWNSPHKDPRDHMTGRVQGEKTAAKLLAELVVKGARVVLFARTRILCELALKYSKDALKELQREDLADRVFGYRGGYERGSRREIEYDMFSGNICGITATSALEIGVDIGSLDAVIICGFPLSLSAFWQQAGRAGRKSQSSLCIYVGAQNPVDQHYMSNPSLLFEQEYPRATIDICNPTILEPHLHCGAYELPIVLNEDCKFFSDEEHGRNFRSIVKEKLLLNEKTGKYHPSPQYLPHPPSMVALRGVQEDKFVLLDVSNEKPKVLEEIEESRLTFTIYDGAIIFHQGNPYLVKDFRPEDKLASVKRVYVDWVTNQRDYTDVDPVETKNIMPLKLAGNFAMHPVTAKYGKIRIESVVFGYFKVNSAGQILEAVSVTNPPYVRYSAGFWIDIPSSALQVLADKKLHCAGAVHAAEHTILSMIPILTIGNSEAGAGSDVQTECKAPEKEFSKTDTKRKRPARLIFYDSQGMNGNGTGVTSRAFGYITELVNYSFERLESCQCRFGCPECCLSTYCSEHFAVMSKQGARVIFRALLGLELNPKHNNGEPVIPDGPEENMPSHALDVETIVSVTE
ncbi:hypothetical protein CANCADRAFT_57410 [Tortispora caseinolytica NRRL Y-17796]|uniref:Uncharacterized protein n=1 Tax=Tortispora caseinolytica NRRL Y-17796 TaxID=767744 RepID=A0A1E4TH30_9ASCO|nr:hypothetical protein CANCADRAFT_57410 [Tortispora caseinolytica NRRL Y-17796]